MTATTSDISGHVPRRSFHSRGVGHLTSGETLRHSIGQTRLMIPHTEVTLTPQVSEHR